MTDPKTFVESNIEAIYRAVALFWEGHDFSEVVGEIVVETDYIKAVTIAGIACNARDLHDDDRPTVDQIVGDLVEGC